MSQLVQVFGAVMILVAYAGAQFRLLNQESFVYLVLNIIGSTLLGILAYVERQWGFLLLEGVWALVSLWSLVGWMRGNQGLPH